MKQPLPKKLARRIFAIRISATILGGAVLVALLALLAMLYWMNAPVPVISPEDMICPGTSASVCFQFGNDDPNSRMLLEDVPKAAARGMPKQAVGLMRKGFADPACRVTFVFSRTSGGDPLLAVSLGRYPGLFRFVSRDLERCAEKSLLPYAIKYYAGKPIFFPEGESSGLQSLSLSGTTLVKSPSAAQVEALLNRVSGAKECRDTMRGCIITLTAQNWVALTQLAGDLGPQWKEATERMGNELPVLNRLEGIFCFSGTALGGGRLTLTAATLEDAAEAAKELPEWIRKNPVIGPTTLIVVKVETREKRAMIDFTARSAPAPAAPAP